MSDLSYKTVLIAGPTASGKSALALQIARRFDGVIINADSMQVYKELRILTARPSVADEARADHRLYGHMGAATAYSTGHWLTDVAREIASVRAQQRLPVIIGGTGLYFKALLEGLSEIPAIDPAVRAYWREQAEKAPASELHERLAKRDEVMACRLIAGDTQRIVRALEVLESTGKSLAFWQNRPGKPVLEDVPGKVIKFVIAPPRPLLYERINKRCVWMAEEGALEEVRRLQQLKLDSALPALRALGVPQFQACLCGEISLEQAVEETSRQTRRYAKRQLTWLRGNMMSWEWLEEKLLQSHTEKIFSYID